MRALGIRLMGRAFHSTQSSPWVSGPGSSADGSVADLPLRAPTRTGNLVLLVDRVWLPALLLFFVVKQLMMVVLIGPFSGHDEVDHFWYVQRIASGDGLGIVGDVELPPTMEPYAPFVADYPLNSEVIQPPLYHAVLALIGNLVPGDTLTTMFVYRLVSVALGVGVVWLSYLMGRQLFPADASIRIGLPVFVALQPQFSFESAIVNHDVLVILLATLGCYLTFRGIATGFSWRLALAIGLISTAGLWTKVSFGLILPVFAVGLLIAAVDRYRTDRDADRNPDQALRRLARDGLLLAGVPLLAITPWFIRNLRLYGDPTGSARLQEISDYALSASTYGEMIFSPVFWRGRLDDFWGNYGWREIPWDQSVSLIVYLCWGVAALGFLAVGLRQLGSWGPDGLAPVLDGYQARCVGLSALAVALMVFAVLYVGTLQFTQSRFAFPAMFAFGLLTALGFGAWLPARWRWLVPLLMLTGLLVLNLVVAVRFVIPYYVGPGGGELVVPEQ